MYFDPDLKPNQMYKYLIEFDRRLGPNWALQIRGIYSKADDLLDDVVEWKDTAWWASFDGAVEPDGWWYWYLANFEYKTRDYKAIEVELNGRISDKFMMNASYTWSQAKGTSPGQFDLGSWSATSGSGYFIGVFGDHVKIPEDNPWYWLDDFLTKGLGGLEYGDEGWYGFLPYSVDHMVKIFASYVAPYDIMLTTAVEYISGYHWEKLGFQPGYGGYYAYPEGRGPRTTPAHVYVDFTAQKDFVIPNGMRIGLRVNVYNLLNSQQPISYIKEDTALFNEVWGRQLPRWIQFHVVFKF
jgi:hypothetical protein